MTRRDYLTIGIFVAGLLALIYLIYLWSVYLPKNQVPPSSEDPVVDSEYDDPYPPYDPDTSGYDDFYDDYDPDDSELPADNYEEDSPASPTRPDYTEPRGSRGGDYLVLAGTFRIRSGAESQVSRLRSKGYSNAELELFDKGTYAVVVVDRFDSYASADALVQELRKKHTIEAYVQEKN